MTWNNFAAATAVTGQQFDDNFSNLANTGLLPVTIAGTNTLTLTLSSNLPTISAYATGQSFMGVAASANTASVTATVGSLGSRNCYVDSAAGPIALTGGEIVAGTILIMTYDAALNGGIGGFHVNAVGNRQASAYGSGFVNKLRNAPLDIWQRGTPVTVTGGSSGYTADGWICAATGAVATVSQVSGRLLTANSMKVIGNTSMTDTTLRQRIEGAVANNLASQICTFQAWLFNSTGNPLVPTFTVRHAGSLDNWASPVVDVNAAVLASCTNGVWTQLAYSFTATSVASLGLEVSMSFGAALNNTSNYVQFCEADLRATPNVAANTIPNFFYVPELRPIAVEMELCQRYLPGFNTVNGTALGPVAYGYATGSLASGFSFDFITQARIAPTSLVLTGAANTLNIYSYANTSVGTVSTGPTFGIASTRKALVTAVTTSVAIATPYMLVPASTTTNLIFTGAEL